MRVLRNLAVAVMAIWIAVSGLVRAATVTTESANALPPLPLHERVLNLPGDPLRPVTLEVTLFTPDGPGPFPLAVVNHGTPPSGHSRDLKRYRASFAAYYFLSRGYAVALPMMRGYGGSGGHVEPHGCDLARTGLGNARDIAAVIDALSKESDIDAGRIVVSGQSFGGWNTLAFGTLGHAGVKGLVNFAGGLRASACPARDQDFSLIIAADRFGAQTRVRSIWFYGDNDRLFPESTWRSMYARYTAEGGQAELVAYGRFLDDAHMMLGHPEGLPIWVPRVDAFLSRIGLPAKPIFPGYLPTPLPPPTHYAAIDDVAAIPYLSALGRARYAADFLHRPFPRVFVVAPDGAAVIAHGGFDPIARALSLCRQHVSGCQLYAVDNDVVWTGPEPALTQRLDRPIYRRTVPAGTTTVLDFSCRVNPDCSSRGIPRLWLVQPPAHGEASIVQGQGFPKFPPDSPFAVCNVLEVPGAILAYTPQAGFTGPDSLVFEEINLDHRDLVFRMAVTVK